MHLSGRADLAGPAEHTSRVSYSDSKLYVLMICMAAARRWPDVSANAVDPGWVPTKMGGRGAPDDLEQGYETQVWLAVSDDARAKASGRYLHHLREARHHPQADDVALQERLLKRCEAISGTPFPQ
jgi:NAD(P)-dependent dehydrogenase (short-subunit alcohol dehydrogenase family)